MSRDSASSKEDFSGTTGTENMTSLSTVLEQDFTVEGRKGQLECPFSSKQTAVPDSDQPAVVKQAVDGPGIEDLTPHHSTDPICAAMYEESVSAPAPAPAEALAKCPIRFMDKHSPDEIAHYVETHKHSLPRSHEVCIRRYQKNEEHIRKLDAKYGNLVNMIEDLSHLHKPMMPGETHRSDEHGPQPDQASTKRVENWANGVSSSEAEDPDSLEAGRPAEVEDRESHFDRPLREVRVGESPSRPWGISVPVQATAGAQNDAHVRAVSPPPVPVRMPSPKPATAPAAEGATTSTPRKCPFDHTKMGQLATLFTDGKQLPIHQKPAEAERHLPDQASDAPVKDSGRPPTSSFQPTFINPPQPRPDNTVKEGSKMTAPPQMVFNISGPVFVGYPLEQAMQFMQTWQQGGR